MYCQCAVKLSLSISKMFSLLNRRNRLGIKENEWKANLAVKKWSITGRIIQTDETQLLQNPSPWMTVQTIFFAWVWLISKRSLVSLEFHSRQKLENLVIWTGKLPFCRSMTYHRHDNCRKRFFFQPATLQVGILGSISRLYFCQNFFSLSYWERYVFFIPQGLSN